jgi:DNA-binding winged helix-turn-helix (wHTH) protein/TolB-like protein/Tfp pilus assembly protein PilF
MNRRSLHYYDFGPFRINVTDRLLQRGADLVPLTPKVFDTLLVLVENCGHVLEKNELIQHLWPDSFVEESSLTQNISLLRRALAEGDADNVYIETIPKRGYRFVGEVNEVTELPEPSEVVVAPPPAVEPVSETAATLPAAVPASRRRSIYIAAASGAVAFGLLITLGVWLRSRSRSNQFTPRSIAVLPFKTIGTPSDQLLGLGMADALIIKLSRLENLTVLPTSSVFRYQERDKGAVEIGRELGVEGVLDGTVQRDGETVRVTAQLIRLSDGKTVWTGKFDERYGSIFAVQDSISEQLTGSFSLQVSEADKKNLTTHTTENTEAYQAYLTGIYFWNRRTRENLPKAITYLEQAVDKDPNFAQARAMLADCYYLSITEEYYNKEQPEGTFERAEASVTKALELDDSLAEAHTVNAGLKLSQRKFDEAGREFRRALELKPTYAVAHLRYAYYLLWELRLEDAVFHMRRAQALDPAAPVTNAALAFMLYKSRDFDGSIFYSKRALELESGSVGARINLGEAYAQKKMFAEAHAEFDKVAVSDPRYSAWDKAYTYAVAGRRDDAYRMLAEVEKMEGRRNHVNYSIVYGALGEFDKAFAELDQIELNRMMISAITFEPQFDHLRGDPRYAAYMQKHGLTQK